MADAREVAGAFRRYEFDVTRWAACPARGTPSRSRCSLPSVDRPRHHLGGLEPDAAGQEHGPLERRLPHGQRPARPALSARRDRSSTCPSLDLAHLTVTAEAAQHHRPSRCTATVRGAHRGDPLRAGRRAGPARDAASCASRPADARRSTSASRGSGGRIAWASPSLYTLALEAESDGALSDRQQVRFGIREVTSELTDKGHRLFTVNGRPILVRGGGWASDMLLRPSRERLRAEMRYVKEMGLNTIRSRGQARERRVLRPRGRAGHPGHGRLVLLRPLGDVGQVGRRGPSRGGRVAAPTRSGACATIRACSPGSNGSDGPPPPTVEKAYLDVLERVRVVEARAVERHRQAGPMSGPSGVKMRGPYDYVPPVVLAAPTRRTAAPSASTPRSARAAPCRPIESLKQMLPPEHLWPMDEFWTFHAGGQEFRTSSRFTTALGGALRQGHQRRGLRAQGPGPRLRRAARDVRGLRAQQVHGHRRHPVDAQQRLAVDDLAPLRLLPAAGRRLLRHQEGLRAAARAVLVRRPVGRGGQRPPGGGARAARSRPGCSTSTWRAKFAQRSDGRRARGRRRARLRDPRPRRARRRRTSCASTSRTRAGRPVSTNFYWLSTRDDVLDWKKTEWFYTPVKQHADLTALGAAAGHDAWRSRASTTSAAGRQVRVRVDQHGHGAGLPGAAEADGRPGAATSPLPVFWEDNYFALLPGETREVAVSYASRSAARPVIEAVAWNAPAVQR